MNAFPLASASHVAKPHAGDPSHTPFSRWLRPRNPRAAAGACAPAGRTAEEGGRPRRPSTPGSEAAQSGPFHSGRAPALPSAGDPLRRSPFVESRARRKKEARSFHRCSCCARYAALWSRAPAAPLSALACPPGRVAAPCDGPPAAAPSERPSESPSECASEWPSECGLVAALLAVTRYALPFDSAPTSSLPVGRLFSCGPALSVRVGFSRFAARSPFCLSLTHSGLRPRPGGCPAGRPP